MMKGVESALNLKNLELTSTTLLRGGITHFIFFGTLLGFNREGTIIPGDDDIDFYVPRSELKQLEDLLRGTDLEILPKQELKYNKSEFFKQSRRVIDGVTTYVDFYLYDDFGDDYIIDRWNYNGKLWNKDTALHVPKSLIFPLQEGEMGEGIKVSVPQDPEGCCKFLYGENWKTPLRKGKQYRTVVENHRPVIKLNEKYKPAPEVIAQIHGISVLPNPNLNSGLISKIVSGNYQTLKIDMGLAYLRPGDRLLEIGAEFGICSSIFAKNIANLTIKSFESNADQIPHIRDLHKYNKLEDAISVSNKSISSSHTYATSDIDPQKFEDLAGEDENTAGTAQYDHVRRDFPHNVIFMDTHGGETAFVETAALDDIDLLLIKLNRKVHQRKDRLKITDLLEKKNFFVDETVLSRELLVFKKKTRSSQDPDLSKITFRYDLDPQKQQSDGIQAFDQAVLAKIQGSEGYQISASVFDGENNRIPEAISWITHKMYATAPCPYPREDTIQDLPGTWLFGGRFNPHFGHFLCETLARLWALDFVDEPIDGVLFFPWSNNDAEKAESCFSSLSKIFNIDFNYKLCEQPYRAERLIVPPQGLGISRLMAGSPEMRQFILKHLERDMPPVDCKKLYISRGGQFGRDGRVFVGEEKLQELLQEEGYTIFSPEEHSWAEQLRHYLSADHIIGADGSAIHLVNYTGRTDLNLGVIRRRNTFDAYQLAKQARLFGVGNANVFDYLGRRWAFSGVRSAAFSLVPEIHFKRLCDDLKRQGFLSENANWSDLTDTEIELHLQTLAQTAGRDVRRVRDEKQDLSGFPWCVDEDAPQVFFDV